MKYYMQQQYYNNSAKVRVYSSSSQGGRNHMEDEFSIVHYKCPPNKSVLSKNGDVLQGSFMFFGIFDGHGGDMAAKYSRDNLCRNIVRQREFWSGEDKKVCLAIHRGFVRTQRNMLSEVGKSERVEKANVLMFLNGMFSFCSLGNWPKTSTGLPSTAGTTASVVFIMNGNYYTGHVGDSRIVLGRQDLNSTKWIACPMTRDHKPESPRERKRIEAAGGQVINKSGIGRVVWNRPKPCLNPAANAASNSQAYDAIPFLAVSRALGDLWSLNKSLDIFIVSPEPDVHCIPIDNADRCLVLASDGLWNMMSNQAAIKVVQDFEETHKPYCLPNIGNVQVSHASQLLDVCMNRWSRSRYRADNTTVLTIMFDNEVDDDDDEEEEDMSDTGSERSLSQTESDEENDPVAQNRIPISTLNPYYLNSNYCPTFYDILSDLYDSGVDPEIDEDEVLFSGKSSYLNQFIGETINEMNSKQGKLLCLLLLANRINDAIFTYLQNWLWKARLSLKFPPFWLN